MKKVFSALLTIVLCFGIAGCINTKEESAPAKENSSQTDTGSTAASVSAGESTSKPETATYDSTDGTPPVNDEMKAFYKKAAELFHAIEFGTFSVDDASGLRKGTAMYYRVSDTRFSTEAELKAYLNNYFTKEFIEKEILADSGDDATYKDIEGFLYQKQLGRGGDMSYAGHVFGAVAANDTVIKMPVKVYYATDTQPLESFYTEPEDTSHYEITERVFELIKENGKWKFSQFYNFFHRS